jgi:hypothetical protein
MANYERDDVRVFDGGDDEEDVESSRLPLLIVIALFVIAAFGAVVWLAYQKGVAQGHTDIPRVIAAQPGPARSAPDNPGGTPTPYTGLKIYQQPAPSEDAANADTAPDTSKPVETPPPPAAAKPVETAPPETKPVTAPPAATKPATTATAAPPPATARPETKPIAPPPATTKPAAETKPVTPPPAAVKPAATPTAPAATAPAAGGMLLQIGSYKSEAEAKAAWETYRKKHAVVSGLSIDIQQADLGAKGTWYRLRIVGGSKALCAKLVADGGACIPAK